MECKYCVCVCGRQNRKKQSKKIVVEYKMLYTGKISEKSGITVSNIMLDEAIKTKVVKVKMKNNRIIAIKLLLKISNYIECYRCLRVGFTQDEKHMFWPDMDQVMQEMLENEKIKFGDN